jgi:DNA-binding PadR family transcriptional regulator
MATTEQPIHVKPPVRPPRELVSSTSFLLKRVGFAVKDRVHCGYDAAEASPFHFTVLAVLDELEERDFIERKRDPADRRRHIVRLTPAGKKTLAKLRALQASIDDDFFAPLDADERKTLHTLLHRLATYHDPRFGTGHS